VAPEESRAKKTAVKKRLSLRLTRFADNGGLKMSNNAAERAMRPIALGGNNYFFLVPAPEDGVRRYGLISVLPQLFCETPHWRSAEPAPGASFGSPSFRAPSSSRPNGRTTS
jgi:Transposase IS66 family